MAYLTVSTRGKESIFRLKPRGNGDTWHDYPYQDTKIDLPRGTIEKILGRKITYWECPIEIK